MNHLNFTKSLAAADVALGVLTAAWSVHARSDVYFSIGIRESLVLFWPAPSPANRHTASLQGNDDAGRSDQFEAEVEHG